MYSRWKQCVYIYVQQEQTYMKQCVRNFALMYMLYIRIVSLETQIFGNST